MLSRETWRNGPSFWDSIEAVPRRMARADRVPTGLAVRKRSTAEPDLAWVPGRATPEIGRPVAVRGLELQNNKGSEGTFNQRVFFKE